MKQYKITSETFRSPGDDPTIPDTIVDPVALAELKKLAGIDSLGIMERHRASSESPVDGHVGTDKAEYQRQHNIRPGTDEWFKLWFARQSLTGEDPMPKKS
jgi:hypothetical protein